VPVGTTRRPAAFAGRLLAAVALLCGCCSAAAETTEELLQRADLLKTGDNARFQTLLGQLDAQATGLTPAQREWIDYFHAWQLGYLGRYEEAVSAFDALIARVQDPTVRARARISMVDDQVNALHYEDAYANVEQLIESQPQIKDHYAHYAALTVAAGAFNGAGQYDLALRYLDEALAYDHDARPTCIALTRKAIILNRAGKLRADDAVFRDGIDACQRIGDPVWGNLLRIQRAQVLVAAGDCLAAMRLLTPYDAEALATHDAEVMSWFRALQARCLLAEGNLDKAREYAQNAIDFGIQQAHSEPAAKAYEILYEIAKRQGHPEAALGYYEKYAAADKGYLNDVSARALAYQMVHQQVLGKKRENDALSEKNKLLELQGQVEAKAAENRLLTIALLVVGLCAIALWGYRVKRSQLKFQKLARRDGLTGIHNRQHFFETAQDALRYCAKSSREASLLVLDLDHFKSVNDMHGHAAGDAVLKRAVAACQARLRSIDQFGRLGGEEFAILLPDCGEATAAERADEMRAAIAGARRTGDAGVDVQVTASFGVATTKACGYNLPTLLAKADQALYVAKNAGRNRVATHQPANAAPTPA
jgi:diguanylate cyclase (GGDEF)-like protein